MLTVLDDMFPAEASAFRFAEFNAYLHEFPDSEVYSDGSALPAIGELRSIGELIRQYRLKNARVGSRVFSLQDKKPNLRGPAYSVFLSNITRFLPAIEKFGAPLAFTLYPGGGLVLGSAECEARMRRVFGSPRFRGVIVTQRNVHQYLLERQFCPADAITFIFGVVTSSGKHQKYADDHVRFGYAKPTFDICFAAHKYSPGGTDKGFDVFVATASLLARLSDRVRFHVIGGHGPDDVADLKLRERMTFHGVQAPKSLAALFSRMDLILSPNPANGLGPGTFDGFPTGSCVEAGLQGVPVFCTDPLNLNISFEDGKDIVLVSRDPAAIAERIENYFQRPDKLAALSQATARTFREVFGYKSQITPRIEFMRRLLAGKTSGRPPPSGAASRPPGMNA